MNAEMIPRSICNFITFPLGQPRRCITQNGPMIAAPTSERSTVAV